MAAVRSKTLKILKEEGLGKAIGYKWEKFLSLPIRAELAWRLGFSLPARYDFLYISSHATGHNALGLFLKKCGVSILLHHLEEGRERFSGNHVSLLRSSAPRAVYLSELYFKNYKRFFSSLTKRVPALVLTRDPVSVLKSSVNFTHTVSDYGMSCVWGGGGGAAAAAESA